MTRLPLTFAIGIGLIAAGCPPDRPGDPATPAPPDEPEAVCLQGEPFVDSGNVPLEAPAGGDADRISQLRWESHEGCERFVIDLVDQDERPAGASGAVSAEVLRDLGVVRVTLREVEWVDPDATDETFRGPLATAAYAVWAPEGRWVYVDVHLAEAAEAHVATLSDPARVVVDLRPGGDPIPEAPPREAAVVVLQPRAGQHSYPLEVVGYARTFEANVVVRLEQDGEDVYDEFTTATSWADAWGHYTFTISDGPTGPVTLHVGEYSARDGTWEGVAVRLDMR